MRKILRQAWVMLLGLAGSAIEPHPDAAPNTHAPGKVDVPANQAFIVQDPADLPGLVFDETDAVLKGTWQYSTHTPPYVGIGYLHDQKADKGKKSVTWTPDFPATGNYELRISHCYNIRRATNTPVIVRHADGETTIRINQQQTPGHAKLFRSLGTFRFEKGRKGFIRISNDTEPEKVAVADAIQLLRVD